MAKEKKIEDELLLLARNELTVQKKEQERLTSELLLVTKELSFQKGEKGKREAELGIANKTLRFQNKEKDKRAAELLVANKELAYQNDEKEKRAAELLVANKELAFQNDEKEKRAAELAIANKELIYQNSEKEKRAEELLIANKELLYQRDEKGNRAAELVIANEELAFQVEEKAKWATELRIANYARSLIEASRDPLFTISPQGKITDINQATINVTGVDRKNLIGTDFFNYFTDTEKAIEAYHEIFAKGFVSDYPLTIRDGKLTDVLFNGSVYKDEQGKLLGVVVVARDVTEQKRIEKEFVEAKVFAELATVIAEEAKAKAETATGLAEAAVKAKQQFLSNMSHEIRTPMNAIIGFTKVILKTALTNKQKEYLNAIKLSGDAMIVLINDILDLAKVDAGKMTFEQIPFKIESSVTAMLGLFNTKALEKNLELVKEYDSNIPQVLLGDRVRLHQIILNLVSNAVKFTSKGSITLKVSLVSQTPVAASIEFTITDTGIGIPENKIEKIFENFQQASSDTSRLYGGTGLGLAIAKKLVESQGGAIRVMSKVDEGSAFSFVLSFQKTHAAAIAEPEELEAELTIRHIKVLVVEDIPLNQLLMKTLLDDFGFAHDMASNGKIAIEKLKSNSYDIILMDLQMPEMNGFEATAYIRNTLGLTMPIIALTADVTTVDLAKCTAVGMDDYIAKPVDERVLYSKIIGLIKKHELLKPITSLLPDGKQMERLKCTNLKYLETRTKSDPKLMMEMISLYLQQTPGLIHEMKLSLLNNDWSALNAVVHKMIPSFLIVGIDPAFKDKANIIMEYASMQRNAEAIPDLVLQLENVCIQACMELEEAYHFIKNNP